MEIFQKCVCHAFLCGEEYVVDRSLCALMGTCAYPRTYTNAHTHARTLTNMHTNMLTPSFTVLNYVVKKRDETLSVTSPLGKCIHGHNNFTDKNS